VTDSFYLLYSSRDDPSLHPLNVEGEEIASIADSIVKVAVQIDCQSFEIALGFGVSYTWCWTKHDHVYLAMKYCFESTSFGINRGHYKCTCLLLQMRVELVRLPRSLSA
jgi:hypothetical protein